MALIVEDGTGKDDADSYVSLADARVYAAAYGITLPVDDTAAEIALRQGAVYVDLQESCFNGARTVDDQALAWPRTDATNIYGIDIPSSTMPKQLRWAQIHAASEYGAGTDVRATDDGKSIASEEVSGAVAVSYFDSGKTGGSVVITKAIDALRALLVSCGNNGFQFRVGRG